jgi:hypothetical protein
MKQWLVNLPRKYWTTAHILWAVVVFTLHAMPSSSLPKVSFWENLGPDKIVHSFMFFLGTFVAIFSGWSVFKSAIVWFFAGVLLENYQWCFTVDRTFDWLDLTFDLIGISLCSIIYYVKRSYLVDK